MRKNDVLVVDCLEMKRWKRSNGMDARARSSQTLKFRKRLRK